MQRDVRRGTATTASPALDQTLFKDQNDTWVDRHAPSSLQPYLKLIRIDRPIGTYLVLLPAWWGIALAAPPGGLPDLYTAALFGAGAFLMRGAGCTMNDMWDRRFDSQVARTRLRPLASGRISLPAALTFLAAQLGTGFLILCQLPPAAIQLGFGAVALAGVYPAMKRLTHFPQAVLGCTMNYGILMSWATLAGKVQAEALAPYRQHRLDWGLYDQAVQLVRDVLDPVTFFSLVSYDGAYINLYGPSLALYMGAACWTMVYDTLYAHQDKVDDAKLGLKSTALWMGERTRPILSAFALAACGWWSMAGYGMSLQWPYYAAVAASTGHMLWQVNTADLNDRLNLTRRFVSNATIGWLMLLGIVAGKLAMEQEGPGDDIGNINGWN